MKLFKVNLFANVNTWRGYDYQTVQLIVSAEEESQIKDVIAKNSEAVYNFFDKKRLGSKRLVGRPIKKNLWLDKFGMVNEIENAVKAYVLFDKGFGIAKQ